MIFDALNDDHRNLLLNTPHQIYLVDGILKLSVTGYKSVVTFGNVNPAGQPQTAVSITIATNDLYELAKQIIEEIESKKDQITKDHFELSTKLN